MSAPASPTPNRRRRPRSPTGKAGKLIPVRIEDYEPAGLLGPIVYIDLVGIDKGEASKRLLSEIDKIVEAGRRKPSSPPEFPGASVARDDDRFPGDLPRIGNLTIRMRKFSGRSTLMDELASALSTDRVCVLHGLSGVGKSRAALEYAHRSGESHRIVWRVRAQRRRLLRRHAELGEALELPASKNSNRDEIFADTINWLAQNDEWLLILDDAMSAEDLADLLPGGRGGRVLITSQAAAGWATIAAPIKVSVLEEGEADQFLADRTGASIDAEVRASRRSSAHCRLPWSRLLRIWKQRESASRPTGTACDKTLPSYSKRASQGIMGRRWREPGDWQWRRSASTTALPKCSS